MLNQTVIEMKDVSLKVGARTSFQVQKNNYWTFFVNHGYQLHQVECQHFEGSSVDTIINRHILCFSCFLFSSKQSRKKTKKHQH